VILATGRAARARMTLADGLLYSRVMALPEHWQPSPDRRILAWLSGFSVLTAGAIWVRRARSSASRR